jgi:hypothetical protein
LLNKERFDPKTFSDLCNCLFKYFGWLVRKGKLNDIPLVEVSTKKRQRNAEQGKPFAEFEVAMILDASKTPMVIGWIQFTSRIQQKTPAERQRFLPYLM